MNVIIQINGREAIPVRALPWLTAWEFSAQEVAEALAHDEGYESFAELQSYRLDEGLIQAVRVGEWLNSVTVSIEEFAERELPRAEWERLSMAALPADTFVWRDEWEPAYNQSPYGPDALAALDDAADSQDIADRTLNFAPHIPPDLVQLVMKGFTQHDSQTPTPAQITTPAPVVAASDGNAKHRNRKPSWSTVAMPYMKSLFASGDYRSATVFYEALKRRVDESDSPFKLINRELYCTEAGTKVSDGSLGNAWPEIRTQ